jgi:hypothetical protein
MVHHRALYGCFLLLILGCGTNQESGDRHASPEQLKSRLDAASSMTNLNYRDDALKAIADDAANAGQAEFVKQALSKMTNLNDRDTAVISCALKLSAAGQDQAAVEIAKTIVDLNKRDEVLRKMAKGKL